MLAPEIEKLADELEGKAKILKVDVDQEQALAMRYGVQSIPTLIVFKTAYRLKSAWAISRIRN
ncbi:MAG: thioredoxin family protein [Clostridium sp.]